MKRKTAKRVSVYMSASLKARLEKKARMEGFSTLNGLIVYTLTTILNEGKHSGPSGFSGATGNVGEKPIRSNSKKI